MSQMPDHIAGQTLFDRIWAEHGIETLADGRDVLFIDRHLVHEVSSPQAFSDLAASGLKVAYPQLTYATVDHIVATEPNRSDDTVPGGRAMIEALRAQCAGAGITLFDIDDDDQGIVHVTMPELGIIQPGQLVCCGDSHTCTLGALGCVPLVVGTSDATQVLATQTVFRKKPSNMRITIVGSRGEYISAKDIVLHCLGVVKSDGAKGHFVEFTGDVVFSMTMDERFTLCNMASEMGAAGAIIAVDEVTIDYLRKCKIRLPVSLGKQAEMAWSDLRSSDTARFDRDIVVDITDLKPQITWGTSPDETMDANGIVPQEPAFDGHEHNTKHAKQLDYMGLSNALPASKIRVDVVFIGSCTNARLSDLRSAAQVLNGKVIASHVRGIVVPGSKLVKRQAEAEGLADIFLTAGFEWREPGCSMCVALNADRLQPGERCVSTSNRNFEGRQGQGGRTHLASPATAAASAIAGYITDAQGLPA